MSNVSMWLSAYIAVFSGLTIRNSIGLETESGNIARGRPTFASSVSNGMSSSRAVDGRFYASGHAYEDCFASEFETSPWWMLELDDPHTITRVYIVTCGFMANISIYIGNTTDVMSFCSYHEGHVNEHTSIIFECEEPIQGKFIQIYSGKDDDDTRPKILSLDEVSLQTAQYTEGLFLPMRRSKTYSSSVYQTMSHHLAIDGSLANRLQQSHCFNSGIDYAPWWVVVLDKYYQVDSVLLQFPTEHSNVSVLVGETKELLILCTFYRGPSAYDDPVKLTCSAPINGRYVKILGNYRTGNQTHKSGGLRLCEVEVYARVIKVPIFDKTCGGVFTDTTGWLASPITDDGNYENNENCWWFIVADLYQAITINITDIDIEDNIVCGYDFLRIYDGFIDPSAIIGTFCGTSTPPALTSIHNVMYLQFKTDDSWTFGGFNATFYNVYVFQCGEVLQNTTEAFGYKSLPSDNKTLFLNCTWVIAAESNQLIDITLTYINLPKKNSCAHGSIQVYDGIIADHAVLGSFCEHQEPVTLSSSASVLFVRLLMNISIGDAEFYFSYNMYCGAVFKEIEYLELESTQFDVSRIYDKDINCTWKIIGNEFERLILEITDIDIQLGQDCENGYFKVYSDTISNEGVIGIYCGSSPPPTISTRSNIMYIQIYSKVGLADVRFSANCMALCGMFLSDSSGSFSSIDSDNDGDFDSFQNCTWFITAGDNQVIRLEIEEMDIEAFNDDLCSSVEITNTFKIYDGMIEDRLLRQEFCWANVINLNESVTSTFSEMFVQFTPRSALSGKGFKTKYSIEAGDYASLLHDQSGWITPFDLDTNGLYDPNQKSTWIILQRPRSAIVVKVVEMDIVYHAWCAFDFLQISWFKDNYFKKNQYIFGTFCGSTPPPLLDVKTIGIIVKLYFQSDGSNSGKGFNATYTHSPEDDTTECGGALNNTSGWIGVSNHVDLLGLDSFDCLWTITAKQIYRVLLRILNLQIDWSTDCENNYLTAYDGLVTPNKQLGVFCGARTGFMQSRSNVMHLRYYSNIVGKAMGFSTTYSQVLPSYSIEIVYRDFAFINEIYSPFDRDGNGQYDNNHDTLWMIFSNPNQVLYLEILNIDIQYGENCEYDSLQIFNTTSRIGIYCGTTLPKLPRSPLKQLIIHFHTDGSIEGAGFNITFNEGYELIEVCATNTLFTAETGMFTSMDSNNDGLYDNNLDCVWTIEASESQIVKLHVQSIDIQTDEICRYDSLEIFELILNGFSGRYCGTILPPVIRSVSNKLIIRFSTDAEGAGSGFNATYWHEDLVCGGILNKTSGEFQALDRNNDGLYDNNLDCHWSIVGGDNQLIELRILSIFLEESYLCSFDYLEVYVNGTSIGKYCTTQPASKMVSALGFDVHFHSDTYSNDVGFVATYFITDIVNDCGAMLNASTTRDWIHFPDIDGDGLYGNSVNCSWTIHALENMTIEITVTIKYIECNYDYLMIFSTSLCGTDREVEIVSPDNIAYIYFFADTSVSGRGFDIAYRAVNYGCTQICGVELDWMQGHISPADCDLDGLYDYNLRCLWTITGTFYLEVNLYIHELDIQATADCVFDSLKDDANLNVNITNALHIVQEKNTKGFPVYTPKIVYDGSVAAGELLGTYCGTYSPHITLTATSSVLTVTFRSDYMIVGSGFKATYFLEFNFACGSVLTERTGSFRPPDVDNSGQYDPRLRCYWVIPATPNHKTYLTIKRMDIEWHELCLFDYLQVYERTATKTALLGTFCGTTAPSVFVSHYIFIALFVSDITNGGKGFRASYYKLEGSASPTPRNTYTTTATSASELRTSTTTSEFTTEDQQISTSIYTTNAEFISENTPQKTTSTSKQTTANPVITTDDSNINHTADFANFSITRRTGSQTTRGSSTDVQTQLTRNNFSEINNHSTINSTSAMETSSKSMISRRSAKVTSNTHSITSSEKSAYLENKTLSYDRNNGRKQFRSLAFWFMYFMMLIFLLFS